MEKLYGIDNPIQNLVNDFLHETGPVDVASQGKGKPSGYTLESKGITYKEYVEL